MDSLSHLPWTDITASVIVLSLALGGRWISVKAIRAGSDTLTTEKRRWIANIRYITLFAIFVSLLIIWGLELSQFALSLAAFAVAIVIASKEIILCFAGGVYRAATGAYGVGDWIQIGHSRGEVLQVGMLSTQISQLSPTDDVRQEFTGRVLTLPNALLLGMPVENLNYTQRYIFHEFNVTAPLDKVRPEDDLDAARAIANAAWSEYEEVAKRYWSMVRKKTGVAYRDPQPEIDLHTTDAGLIAFQFRIYCQREKAGGLETRMTTALLDRFKSRYPAQNDTPVTAP